MTLREALTRAASQLSAHPALRPTAVPDATLLLMYSLQVDRAGLIAHPERRLDRDQQAAIQRLVERRLNFEPIQYITGEQEFYGLTLHITKDVLIPRPETELLVEAVVQRLGVSSSCRIVDVGTGSGAIAIALAYHVPPANVTAVDVSPAALEIARGNARAHSVEDRISFLESDLLDGLADEAPFDAIVSNPPYIPSGDAPSLHPQVRDHEPAQALFAGPGGLDIYRRLIPQAFCHLRPGGLLALEIGYGQRDAIGSLLAGWDDVEFLPDLQHIPRVALARKASRTYKPAYQSYPSFVQ